MRGLGQAPQVFRSPRLGADLIPDPAAVLRWVYVGRVSVASVLFVAAAAYFRDVAPEVIVILAVAALVSVAVTGASFLHTHVRRAAPGSAFLYAQALFDLALVTAIVHVTGGGQSDFAPLYIIVIAVSGVMMPFRSSLFVTMLAALLYIVAIVFRNPAQLSVAIWLQVGAFLAVAFAVGWLAHRLHIVRAQRSVLEKEVRRLTLEASDILREISSAVVTVDGDGALVYGNSAAERLLDFSVTDRLNQPILDFLQERSPELWRAIVATQREGQRQVRAEGMIQLDGRSFYIGMSTTLHELEEGGRGSVTAIFTDITDQKRIDMLKLRTQRLQAVAELSASLAHEIKNPLASIRSSVEQLGHSSRSDEDERSLSNLIVRESDRLSRLLSEFLDFSRVQMRKARAVDLAAITRGAIELVREHPDCPPDADICFDGSPVLVHGDEDLLHRVVVNLVLNALQASEGRAKVRVTVSKAPRREVPRNVINGPSVLLRVADDGPGIAGELRDRLFDPFVTGRAGGSGLGLAIVQRAVEAHRGVVLVDSDMGVGTTFSVFLPRKSDEEVAA